jgi:hypothetical protein
MKIEDEVKKGGDKMIRKVNKSSNETRKAALMQNIVAVLKIENKSLREAWLEHLVKVANGMK